MFKRKNQKQELYRKMVEQSVVEYEGGGSDEELMTVKRVDHELPSHLSTATDHTANISKRKLKIGKSKKAMAKTRSLGEKLIFDEEGNAHQVYEMRRGDELEKQGINVLKLGKEFTEEQRGVMKQADVIDKAIAKEKRKEKKRKQKDREKVHRLGPSWLA